MLTSHHPMPPPPHTHTHAIDTAHPPQAELPVFMPDLYSEFYSGSLSSKPALLPRCTAQNTTATQAYFQDNVNNNLRLKRQYNPQAKVPPSLLLLLLSLILIPSVAHSARCAAAVLAEGVLPHTRLPPC
jgi:hypothetical protein